MLAVIRMVECSFADALCKVSIYADDDYEGRLMTVATSNAHGDTFYLDRGSEQTELHSDECSAHQPEVSSLAKFFNMLNPWSVKRGSTGDLVDPVSTQVRLLEVETELVV